MRHIVIFASALLFQSLVFGATYNIDKNHSSINFTVKHMGISNVKGSFSDYEGKITMDGDDPAKGNAIVSIKTDSINTGTQKRDEHLKSGDFFDVAKFPEMTFETKKITKVGKKYKIDGKLTLHGQTKDVHLDGEYGGKVTDPQGATRVAFSATGKLDRRDFGLTWNKPMQKAGSMLVGNDIKMDFEIEAVEAK